MDSTEVCPIARVFEGERRERVQEVESPRIAARISPTVRRVLVIVLLASQVLTIVAGRCKTLWHDADAHVESSSTEAHDHHHDHHHRIDLLVSIGHEHPSEAPDHSHMPEFDSLRKASRLQNGSQTLKMLATYTEIAFLEPPAIATEIIQP